jgi:hypothetical protein
MKRCPLARTVAGRSASVFSAVHTTRILAGWLVVIASSALVSPGPALAQSTSSAAAPANPLDQRSRQFPADARRGILQVAAANVIQMDGKPDRLAPGARIRDAQNRIVLTGALVGQTLRVNYTRETGGQVHEVWILTAEEAAQKRAGNNDLVQRNFRFASED